VFKNSQLGSCFYLAIAIIICSIMMGGEGGVSVLIMQVMIDRCMTYKQERRLKVHRDNQSIWFMQ